MSQAWLGAAGANEREAVGTMNFTNTYDYLLEGREWRGVRTKDYSYARWLDGKVELFDLKADGLEMDNLAEKVEAQDLRERLEGRLGGLMAERNDELVACDRYEDWFDGQRRVVRNAWGPMANPEVEPDWSLLGW